MAKALLEWETIDASQVQEIMEGKQPSPPKSSTPTRASNDGGTPPSAALPTPEEGDRKPPADAAEPAAQ